jgi:hypothetical protein
MTHKWIIPAVIVVALAWFLMKRQNQMISDPTAQPAS